MKQRPRVLAIAPCWRDCQDPFLELLRWQLQFATQGRSGGWLAGLLIPRWVRRLLCFMRSQIGRGLSKRSRGSWGFACGACRLLCRTGRRVADPVSRGLADTFGPAPAEQYAGVAEIAGRVGYDSDAAFNRAFRRVVGSAGSMAASQGGATSRRERRAAQRQSSPGESQILATQSTARHTRKRPRIHQPS